MDCSRNARDALVQLIGGGDAVALLQFANQVLLKIPLALEEVLVHRCFRKSVAPHLHDEDPALQRKKSPRHRRRVAHLELEPVLNDAHFAMQARTHVTDVLILPHERDDEHRLPGEFRSAHRHLGDTGKERMHKIVRPANGTLRVEQHAMAVQRTFHRVRARAISTVVGHQVVHAPECGRGSNNAAVGPTGHARRHVRGDLLVHKPITGKLRVIGPQKGGGLRVYGAFQATQVSVGQLHATNPAVRVNKW